MLSIHDAAQIGPELRGLIDEWLHEVFPADAPEILVAADCNSAPSYTLGPLVTLAVSGDYERSYIFNDHRVYMSPLTEPENLNDCDCGYLLPVDECCGSAIYDGLLWVLAGRTLRIARLDEASLADNDHTLLNSEARRMVLTELFREPFMRLFTRCKEPPGEAETIAAFGKFHAQISALTLSRTEADIQANIERMADLNRQLQQTLTALAHQREQLRLLKLACNIKCPATGATIERIGRQLHRLAGARIESISIGANELSALHKDVSIESADGETSELGDIRLSLSLADDRELIRFERVRDNEDRDGYFHPHIAQNGAPCLGNIGEDVAKLLEQREWGTLLLLLDEFLRSYNDQNPYVQWFGEDSEEDAYEECYENGEYNCIECHDSGCPYWDGRFRRCHESSTNNDCVWCANCDCQYFEDELNECRANHKPAQCLDCKVEHCVYHFDDEEECYDNNADECAECARREECDAYQRECAEPHPAQTCGPESAAAADGGGGETVESLDAGGGG